VSRFLRVGTRTVDLGPCECPGTPHQRDTAEVYTALCWDDLVDVGLAPTEGAARRLLVTRAIASWTLLDAEDGGEPRPVPITEETVRRLSPATVTKIAEAVGEAYAAAIAPPPNPSGAPSRPSRPESAL
jgi:hypothetical protein